MSVKTQKIILFIPIVNFVVITVQWLLMYHRYPIPKTRFLKNFLIIALCFFIIFLISDVIFGQLFDNGTFTLVKNYIACYLYFLTYSAVALNDQEKYYKQQ